VLPFESDTDDEQIRTLGAAIAEGVVDLQSANRPAVPFRASQAHRAEPACTAADALDAGYVLTGSLLRSGDQLRTRATITACPEDEPIWQEAFDHVLGDTFELADRIATQLYQSMSPTLWAYQDGYARARLEPGDKWFHHMAATEEDNRIAHELFDRDTEAPPPPADPSLPWVHAWQPRWQALLFGWGEAPDILADMRHIAARCLEVDSTAIGCLGCAANVALYSGEPQEAVDIMERAADLSRRNASTLLILASMQSIAGRPEEALSLIQEILDATPDDPTAPISETDDGDRYAAQALAYFAAGRYEDARDAASKVAAISGQRDDPYNTLGRSQTILAASQGYLGDQEAAGEALDEARALGSPLAVERLSLLYGGAGSDLATRLVAGLSLAGLEPEP
jgi:TolB-like protein